MTVGWLSRRGGEGCISRLPCGGGGLTGSWLGNTLKDYERDQFES
jgi:hypothetical protein